MYFVLQSIHPKNIYLFFAGQADPFLHLVKILGKGAAPCRREAVFGARYASLEIFQAGDVFGLFEFAGMHAEIAVSSFKDALEVVKAEAGVGCEGADDTKAHALVYKAVELGELEIARGQRLARRLFCGLGLFASLLECSTHRASAR